MVQISEALEAALLAFRCRVNVALRNRHAAVTRYLLIVKASAPASPNSLETYGVASVSRSRWKLQIASELLVKMIQRSPRYGSLHNLRDILRLAFERRGSLAAIYRLQAAVRQLVIQSKHHSDYHSNCLALRSRKNS